MSRFPADWGKAPDIVFAEAESIGCGMTLELLAIEQASRHLDRVGGYVSMNLSPRTLAAARCLDLIGTFPPERIVLELSEHDPVEDYDAMRAALAPLRARGVRLAIDDVGAGYSSLRHIMLTKPDIIKLDRSIVAGVADDLVLRALVHSLVEFGHASGATVVAEGFETFDDMQALRELRVDAGQGWYFARADEPDRLLDLYPPFTGPPPSPSAAAASSRAVNASTQSR